MGLERGATARREMPGGVQAVLHRGIAGWLMAWWRRSAARRLRPSRLSLIERIPLGPRQALSLVEADGTRLLIATSADSAPVFFALGAKSLSMQESTIPEPADADLTRLPNDYLGNREAGPRAVKSARRAVDRTSVVGATGRSRG